MNINPGASNGVERATIEKFRKVNRNMLTAPLARIRNSEDGVEGIPKVFHHYLLCYYVIIISVEDYLKKRTACKQSKNIDDQGPSAHYNIEHGLREISSSPCIELSNDRT